jgi:hypothetical protein
MGACCHGSARIVSLVGRTNFCIDTSLQAFKDSGTNDGAEPVGGNVRVSEFTWDPEQPGQTIGGIDGKDGVAGSIPAAGPTTARS